jgi:tetratricopeptide (TPR) repeat protein
LVRARDAEKAARENELKALEREKTARDNLTKSRDDEKKALEQATRLRAELDQSSLAWHRQLAEQWEKAGQWTAAAFHLGRLIENSPKDEMLLVRRADAYRQGGEHLLAVADYSRAMQLKPGLALHEARDLCLRRSMPAQASGTIGLAATGVLGAPFGVHLLLATPRSTPLESNLPSGK